MNPHERTFTPAALAPAPRWNRQRLIVIILTGVLLVSASGYLALRYFIRCGNCGPSPILCTDPCTLPTFGQILDRYDASNERSASVTASAPSPPPHRAS